MPQIRFKTGKQKGKVVPLKGNRLLIGRDNACQVQILDQGVSREHAEIYSLGEMVFIRDMESRNGSFVNDEKITEELLREGDLIRVGNTQLLFESNRGTREQDLEFEEDGEPFKTSLDLKIEDLYVADSGPRDGELFKAVCAATQIVQSERDEKKLFERMLDLIQEYIPADHLFLFLRDDATGAVTPRAMRATSEKKNVPISRSILRRVISESRAILTADAMQDDRFKADDSIVMNQIRAVLCVPIHSSGQAMGAIYAVNSSVAETFEQSDLQLISAMGAQLALSLENLNSIRARRRMFLRTIGRLVSLLEGTTIGHRGHAERVSSFSLAIASEMGLPDSAILHAGLIGLLHNIGRVTQVAVLAEATPEAPELSHVTAGVEFLKNIPGLQDVLPAIRSHHEKYDGSGVPDGLKGDAIPVGARIVMVASAFDKLIYPANASPDVEPDAALVKKAFKELDHQAGLIFDSNVVRALIVSYRHGALRGMAMDESGKVPTLTSVYGKSTAVRGAHAVSGLAAEIASDLPATTGETIRARSEGAEKKNGTDGRDDAKSR